MLRAPQAAVVLLSFIIFTTLDCWDWFLGCFYSFLDAHLQADHHKQGLQAANPISYHTDSRAPVAAGTEREAGEKDTRRQLTVCICKRLGESGRARRLRAIRDGKWHKCSCWGWELGVGHRPHQNGLDGQVSGGLESRKPQLPAVVDPLAGAPDSENPPIQKARNFSPVKPSEEGFSSNQTGGFLGRSTSGVKGKAAGVAPSRANFISAAPANHLVVDAPSHIPASPFEIARHHLETRHQSPAGYGPPIDASESPSDVSKAPGDVSKAPGDVSNAPDDGSIAHSDVVNTALPTGRKHSHRRNKKKRSYVGRWTDCQCPHCTEVRTQRHRQLFVRIIGRGVNRPSAANGHFAVDVNGFSGEAANGLKDQSTISKARGAVNKLPKEGVNGFLWGTANGHLNGSGHESLGGSSDGFVEERANGYSRGSANGHFGEGVNGHFSEGVNGHVGESVIEHLSGTVNRLIRGVNGHQRGSVNGLIAGGVNGHIGGGAHGHSRGSVNGHIGGGSNGLPKKNVNRPRGTKPDLLFIHGYCASSNFWADTVFQHLPPALLESRRVFAPDLLGTGKSPRPHDCHYTLRDHVEALEAVLAAHDVRTFHVIGHSMGSLMAVVLAARNVSRVLSVTLFSPVYADMDRGDPPCEALLDIWAPGTADRWGRVPRVLWQRTLSSIPRWYLNFARFNTHVLYGQHTLLEKIIPRLLPTLPASFVSDFLRDTWDVQLHMFNNTLVAGGHALDSAYQVLADANIRILVDHGTADHTCPFEGSEALARKYANVELRRCEKADHLHVVAGREREVVVEIVEEIARAERKRRLARK